jgi:hypothetical protein
LEGKAVELEVCVAKILLLGGEEETTQAVISSGRKKEEWLKVGSG